jgi:hypothetical protein
MPAPKKATPSTLKTGDAGVQPVQTVRPEPLKTLLSWEAPVRVFKKREREYFTTIAAIVFLLIIILLFIEEWMLIILIIALTFLAYIMATVEPPKVDHKVTNRGIITGGRRYNWSELGRFWFEKKWDQTVLHIESMVQFPSQLMLLLGKTNQDQVKKILSQYLLFEEPEKTWVDNASSWLSRRVPLEGR